MKNFLVLFIILGSVSCGNRNTANNQVIAANPQVQTFKGVTSVDSILSPGIKSSDNTELSIFYKIIIDTSDNEDLLREKMYRLHKKLQLPFARQIINIDPCKPSILVMETSPTILDRASEKIIKDGAPFFLDDISKKDFCTSYLVVHKNEGISNNDIYRPLIRFDYVYTSCPLQSYNKSAALIVDVFQSKKIAQDIFAQIKKFEKNAYMNIHSVHIKEQEPEPENLVASR